MYGCVMTTYRIISNGLYNFNCMNFDYRIHKLPNIPRNARCTNKTKDLIRRKMRQVGRPFDNFV